MRLALLGLVSLACSSATPRPPIDLTSTAERSRFVRTGRYAEAMQLCEDFERAYDRVTCDEIGRTTQDRPIVALTIARRPGLPVLYIQAGIHAGEIEGKDAGFAFLRDLLDAKVAPGALDAFAIVFVPVMNPDGHERMGPNQRPNQRGPAEMGFRTNGVRLNLNRDHVKADSPEVQATLRLIAKHDPVLLVDLHTTDGAKFEHDISVSLAPYAPRADELEETARGLADRMMTGLAALGHLPVRFYPSFVKDDEPASGFALGEAPPRFSTWYMAARSRMGMLVETHSWRTFPERVKSTYHTLQVVAEEATRHAGRWRQIADAATRADRKLAGTDVPLIWENTETSTPIEFRGYRYEKRPSDLGGGTWLRYDETAPEIWKVPLYTEVQPAITVRVPRGGYIVDGGFAKVAAAVLDRHGITYAPLDARSLRVEAFRATSVTYGAPYEGRTRPKLVGAWAPEQRTLERGAIFVSTAQPNARLIAHLFDPALPDSLAQWGHFNAVFEQKEYMEAYVIEEQARAMIDQDPALRAQFDAAVASDPELAKSTDKRLEWFYRRHPAWDRWYMLLPVYRTDDLLVRR